MLVIAVSTDLDSDQPVGLHNKCEVVKSVASKISTSLRGPIPWLEYKRGGPSVAPETRDKTALFSRVATSKC